VNVTLYKAETTTLTATQGAITGTSNSFTVNGLVAAGFSIDTVATQTAGTAFGVTVRAVDTYGNASGYTGAHTIAWTLPLSSPNGTAPFYPSTATALTFSNINGQGVAVATGIDLYNASGSTSLKATELAKTGTSASFLVNAAAPSALAFINCTQPTSANTTCTGSPLSTGNNGTLQANVAVKDTYGNTAVATSTMTISLSSSSTPDYTVLPTSVTISPGGSQSQQLTVTPAKNNPGLTTIRAQTSGGFADGTVQVQK